MITIGGENLIDYVQTEVKDGLPVYTAIPGGSCYNVAIAAARQGQTVSYVTPISTCLLYTSPSPRDRTRSRMPSSA